MFTVIVKNESSESIEKNKREFITASSAVAYLFQCAENYEGKETRTLEMKQDSKLILTKYTYKYEPERSDT